MPTTKTNKLGSLQSIQKQNTKLDTKEAITTMSSFSGTKDFKKRDPRKVLPPMTVKPTLVEKFREEAKDKNWTNTALMNQILEERYGKVEE